MKQLYRKQNNMRGAALLIVLFIVMAITVLSLGFLSRCDTELACGQNMALRAQTDALAYSGLEHAKGLTLYPQDIATTGYWTGASAQQLGAGDDYYDVTVVRHDAANDPDPTYRCTYNVKSEAYRLKNSQKVGRSAVEGELRLDPCIVYGAKTSTSIPSRMIICGDTYCNGSIVNLGTINGDVFTSGLSGSGTASGQTKAITDLTTVSWPAGVTVANFKSKHTQVLPAAVSEYNYSAVCYRNGTLSMGSGVTVDGMLMVEGDLDVNGVGNNINAGKNLPALIVTGDLIIEDGAELTINGLAVVQNRVKLRAGAGDFNVYGALFADNGVVETMTDYSGKANTAFLYNAPTWRPTGGQIDGAIDFDGVDDYLRTADSSTTLQIANDYTFSVWVKADASQKALGGLFSKTDISGSTNQWTLRFDTSGDRHAVVYHQFDSWNTGIKLNSIAGAWHNITVVRNGTKMWSYLDNNPIKISETWNLGPTAGSGHLNIGVDRTANSTRTFKGLIDELKIYDSSASDGSVNPPGNPIGYWKFDRSDNKVNIYAEPHKAAVVVGTGSSATRWGQAGGAFYRDIKRY